MEHISDLSVVLDGLGRESLSLALLTFGRFLVLSVDLALLELLLAGAVLSFSGGLAFSLISSFLSSSLLGLSSSSPSELLNLLLLEGGRLASLHLSDLSFEFDLHSVFTLHLPLSSLVLFGLPLSDELGSLDLSPFQSLLSCNRSFAGNSLLSAFLHLLSLGSGGFLLPDVHFSFLGLGFLLLLDHLPLLLLLLFLGLLCLLFELLSLFLGGFVVLRFGFSSRLSGSVRGLPSLGIGSSSLSCESGISLSQPVRGVVSGSMEDAFLGSGLLSPPSLLLSVPEPLGIDVGLELGELVLAKIGELYERLSEGHVGKLAHDLSSITTFFFAIFVAAIVGETITRFGFACIVFGRSTILRFNIYIGSSSLVVIFINFSFVQGGIGFSEE